MSARRRRGRGLDDARPVGYEGAVGRFRMGILDVTAVVTVLIAILLPERSTFVEDGYARDVEAELPEKRARVATLQGRLAEAPGDGAAADQLSQLLVDMGQHDMALRVAGAAAQVPTPSTWRSLLAVSSVHAERIEIEDAHAYAARALEACQAADARCAAHEDVRLQLYFEQLEAGVAAIASGADPRVAPEEFRREMARVHPTARFRPGRSGASDR